MQGRFITIEGIEGAGKSTAMQTVAAVLDEAGVGYVQTREPGGTPLGEDLRELLLSHRHRGMSADAELLLMFAARAEHISSVIRPALEAGNWVLCDRFTDASFAYQGAGRGIPPRRVAAMEEWVQGGLRPDLTLLLDLPPEVGLERAGRRSEPDRFEIEEKTFFARVRGAYLALADAMPERIRIIDARRDLEAVSAAVRRALKRSLDAWG